MAKYVVDGASLTAVAEKLREEFPDEKFAFPDGVVEGIDRYAKEFEKRGYNTGASDGFTDGYNVGKVNGLDEGAAICAAKHFVHNFVGDGGSELTFRCPFEPDCLTVMSYDPTLPKTVNAVGIFNMDVRAFGLLGGFALRGDSSSMGVGALYFTSTSVLSKYSRTEDGYITLKNLHANGTLFPQGFIYTIVAAKYTDQTDKERITDFVNRLTGSGTTTLNQAKVEAAFTDDEWAALIATKPDWTFTWI